MTLAASTYIALGTIFLGVGLMSFLSRRIEGRSVLFSLVLLLIAGAGFGYSFILTPGGLTFEDVPLAFVEIAAWILGR